MVLSRRPNTNSSQRGSSTGIFDGLESSDIMKIIVFLRDFNDERRERTRPKCFWWNTFCFARLTFFYDAFVEDVQYTEEGWDYEKFQQVLVDKLGRKDPPEYKVKRESEKKLYRQEFLNSLNRIIRLYEHAKLDEETNSNLLKNQLRRIRA